MDSTDTVQCTTECVSVSQGFVNRRFQMEMALINTEADLRACRAKMAQAMKGQP